MVNFIAYNPVKLYFGKDVVQNLSKETRHLGKDILLLTGKNSAKKYGYYDEVIEQLKKNNHRIVEFSGIKPNPTLNDANKALELAKKEQIDFIVALGGGSVIDTAKLVGLAYANHQDIWDLMKRNVTPNKGIPLITILTIAATGTEMNAAAVLQNHQTQEKIGLFHPLMYPKVSFLDPSYTLTVPKNQTINGIVDLIAHSLEAYFGDGDASLSDRFAVANINEAFDYSYLLINDLSNYDLRSRMMWNATVAENGTTMHGRQATGDWGTHALAHHISLLWDIPHGQTLSIIFPAWMKVMKNEIPERIVKLGKLLTRNDKISADETIAIFEDFFKKIEAPVRMKDLNLTDKHKKELLQLWHINKPTGLNISLDENHYKKIIELI